MNSIKDELVEMTEKFIDESKERRALAVSYARSFIKPKAPQPEPGPKRDYHFSEDARERMDQRRYQNQIEAENTLSEKQHAVLTNYSNGLPLMLIAARLGLTRCAVVRRLRRIRERLETLNNAHSVAVALRKGLIQ